LSANGPLLQREDLVFARETKELQKQLMWRDSLDVADVQAWSAMRRSLMFAETKAARDQARLSAAAAGGNTRAVKK
jgi:hypothetical protein